MSKLIYLVIAAILSLTPMVHQMDDDGNKGELDQRKPVGAVYYSFDEGKGQVVHADVGPGNVHELGQLDLDLGSSGYEDECDPRWSSNTPYGHCLDLFGDDLITGTYDLGIMDGPFSMELWVCPRVIEGRRAIFSFEDSDNDICGIYIDEGFITTRWGDLRRDYSTCRLGVSEWCKIGYQFSEDDETLYLDGAMIGTQRWDMVHPRISDYQVFSIGAELDDGRVRNPFIGMIDELTIFKGVLDMGGVVGSWNFQEGYLGEKKLVHDRSGWGNDGRCVNMEDQDFVQGVYGRSLAFDGKDEYVNCGNSSVLPIRNGQEWAISLWLWPGTSSGKDSSNGICNSFLSWTSSSSSDIDPLEIGVTNDLQIDYHLGIGGPSNGTALKGKSITKLPKWSWSHLDVIISRTGDIWKFSIHLATKGAIVDMDIDHPFIDPIYGNLTIGGSNAEVPSFFSGRVDEVRITNTASKRPILVAASYYSFDGDANDDSMFHSTDLTNNLVTFTDQTSKYMDRSAYFDGSQSFLFTEEEDELLNPVIMLQVWLYPLSLDDGDVILSMQNTQGTIYGLSIENGHICFILAYSIDGNDLVQSRMMSKMDLPSNRWTHITAQFTGGEMAIHMNGLLDNISEIEGGPGIIQYGVGSRSLFIGASSGNPTTGHYHGYMDELMISGDDIDLHNDIDGDGMCDMYEVMRSTDSRLFDPNECNMRYALIVGNNPHTWDRNVGYAVANDANDMRALLRSLGYQDCDISFLVYGGNILEGKFPDRSYLDGEPTKDTIVEVLKDLSKVSTMSDLFLVYYSGHGDQGPDGDADEDHYDFSGTGVNNSKLDERIALAKGLDAEMDEMTDDEYSTLLVKVKARQVVHMIISCSSGGFFEDIEQIYERTYPKPWAHYTIITPAHESDIAYVKDKVASFFGQSFVGKALRREDLDDWSDRASFGRVSWEPDIDVTLGNMRYMEQDGSTEDAPTKMDDPPHWQRNHYTEDGYQPGFEKCRDGQDFPDIGYNWGENDKCTKWVSRLDYSPSNGNGIVDLEEAFYFSVHNEYLEGDKTNPEADPSRPTDLGDDPLMFDSSPNYYNRIYL